MDFICKISPFFILFIFFPELTLSEETIFYSKASFYYATDGLGTPKGGCGYGEYGRTINEGDVALVASAKLFKGGAGCGACYKVMCKETECNTDGMVVVVTDHGVSKGGETDFILSTHAFNKMAIPGHEKDLRDYGTVHIEYQRIACQYPGKTLTLQVVEHSQYPSYLAFQFLYVEGNADIVAVELFEEDTLEWKTCRRSYGAIWDMVNPPRGNGSLTVRFFLNGSGQNKVKARWVLVPNVIPPFWEPGAVYDTFIQLR